MKIKIITYNEKGIELLSRDYDRVNDDDITFEQIQSITEDSEQYICDECKGTGEVNTAKEIDEERIETCYKCGGDGLKAINI